MMGTCNKRHRAVSPTGFTHRVEPQTGWGAFSLIKTVGVPVHHHDLDLTPATAAAVARTNAMRVWSSVPAGGDDGKGHMILQVLPHRFCIHGDVDPQRL